VKSEVPPNTQAAIEHLIQVALEEKVVIAGFAFSIEPPSIVNFGNCRDAGELRLFTMLCQTINEKKSLGQVIVQIVERPV